MLTYTSAYVDAGGEAYLDDGSITPSPAYQQPCRARQRLRMVFIIRRSASTRILAMILQS